MFTSLTLLDVRSSRGVPAFARDFAAGCCGQARPYPQTPSALRRASPLPAAYAHPMEQPISRAEAERRVKDMPGWELAGDSIARQFTFAGFPEAISFVVRLGFAAEAADHHPDITINYKRVTLSYSTHSEGGLTEKDFAGAQMADRVA